MEEFVNVLAFIGSVVSLVIIILKVVCACNYTELDRWHDLATKGGYKTFPITREVIIFVVCIAWFVSKVM